MRRGFLYLGVLIFILSFQSCSYVISGIRYLTQESYISGEETLNRIETAAFLGYSFFKKDNPDSADLFTPMVTIMSARIKEDRMYLETQVESCEEIVFVSNYTGLSIEDQMTAGLLCNLGPGKSPSEM